MDPSNLIGATLAVASAAVWGSGDFAGGLAARRLTPYQVTAAAALCGLASLLMLMWLRAEPWPAIDGILWSAAAGLAGALGIACLYRGLATGGVSLVATVSAVMAAALPVAFAALTEGLPAFIKLMGFALGALGIVLVSQSVPTPAQSRRSGLLLGALAGAGFGLFFILISNVKSGLVFSPLVIARASMFLASLALVGLQRQRFPSFAQHPMTMLAGVFDAGGNVLFLFARQYTRLDVASVLASLYPASTILLARLILKEPIQPVQMIGVVVCLLAIGLIVV